MKQEKNITGHNINDANVALIALATTPHQGRRTKKKITKNTRKEQKAVNNVKIIAI